MNGKFDPKLIIKNVKHIIKYSSSDYNEPFHVAFGIDKQYVKPAGITIFSLIQNNQNQYLHFHLFLDTISEQDLAYIERLGEFSKKISITLYFLNLSFFPSLSRTERYPLAIYFRLFIPIVLEEITEQVLYLDADILCINSVTELFNFDFKDSLVAVIKDQRPDLLEYCSNLDVNSELYFNSGVLLINTKKWLARDITNQVIILLENEKYSFKLPDQDALNILLKNEISFLDKKFNLQYDSSILHVDKLVKIESDTVFIHFVGAFKPWQTWGKNSIYTEYYNTSPWRNTSFNIPINYKQKKYNAIMHWRTKNILKSVYWFFSYLISKITK